MKLTRLIVLVLFPLTIAIIYIVTGLFDQQQSENRESTNTRVEQTTKVISSNLAEELKKRSDQVISIAEQASATDDYSTILASDSLVDTSFNNGIAIFTLYGNVLASQKVNAQIIDSWFSITSDPSPYSSITTDPTTGNPLQRISATKKDIQVVGAYNPYLLIETVLANASSLNEDTAVYILDKDGTELYISPNGDDFTYAQKVSAGFAQNGAIGAHRPTKNNSIVYGYAPIRPTGWTLIISESADAYRANVLSSNMQLGLFLMLPLAIFSLGALLIGYWNIFRPLQHLATRSAELGDGEFDAIKSDVGGIESIQLLQSELVNLSDKVSIAQSNLRSQMGAVTLAQEEERRRLARELHDDSIQSLIGLNQRIQLAELQRGAGATLDLPEMRMMITDIIETLRRVTLDLRPVGLDELGLVSALEQLIQSQSHFHPETEITFSQEGEMMRLTEDTEFALYRITQESLNNTFKHAQATKIHIVLTMTDEDTSLEIKDNGRGFYVPNNLSEMAVKGHFGLLGINERVELIGGTLTIHSVPTRGTRLHIEL